MDFSLRSDRGQKAVNVFASENAFHRTDPGFNRVANSPRRCKSDIAGIRPQGHGSSIQSKRISQSHQRKFCVHQLAVLRALQRNRVGRIGLNHEASAAGRSLDQLAEIQPPGHQRR